METRLSAFVGMWKLPNPALERTGGADSSPGLGAYNRRQLSATLDVACPTPPRGSPGRAVLISLPGTAQLRMNAHRVDRARPPFDLGRLPTANAIPGVSSPTRKQSSAITQRQPAANWS